MDAKWLRSQIEQGLGKLIGVYTLPNNRKVKAIAVLKSYETYPPDGTQIEGLEIVIFYPVPLVQAMLCDYRIENEWTIHLKQWDKAKHLHEASRQILKVLGDEVVVKQTLFTPPMESMGLPEMLQIKLSTFEQG